MTELKTLKDLDVYDKIEGLSLGVVDVCDLKAEAVKWVKIYRNDIIDHQDQIEFIKLFFNLTEEDLEEK